MKTKMHWLDKEEEILIGTFEEWGYAEQCALLLRGSVQWDIRLSQGRSRRQIFYSRRINICPGCGCTWRYQELWHREKYGTHRCDCGVLFEIDWKFRENERLRVVDRDSQAGAKHLRSQESRQV